MIERIVLAYLEEKLGIPIYMEEPIDISEECVMIEKTGSGGDQFIKKATIAVKSYADTKLHAAQLNEKVKDEMKGIVELDEITRCSLNSDYDYTDTARKRYRYQAVFDIAHY
mgnify:CR=1 FL=1